eukprot:jgi/Psemu1/69488/estExt_Genemark1.C_8860008
MSGTSSLLPKTAADRKPDNEHPEDDAVLASIRTVRKLVTMEFRLDEDERRTMAARLKAMRQAGGEQKTTGDVGEKEHEEAKESYTGTPKSKSKSIVSDWRAQCYQLKQQLEEEQDRTGNLEAKREKQISLLTRQLREAREEAAVDREMKSTLLETLAAQHKHGEKLQLQLAESRTLNSDLGTKLRAVVATMEEEHESIAKERDVALLLLEESRQQLRQLTQTQAEDSTISRIRQLEETNTRLLVESKEAESKSLRAAWIASTQSTLAQTASTSALQQKLRQLDDSLLERNAGIIQLLQQQIASMERNEPQSEGLSLKKKQLREAKERLRIKSLDVLGDTIVLQLQRLVQIHRQTTTITTQPKTTANNTNEELDAAPTAIVTGDSRKDEWEATLQTLAENRARYIALCETEALNGDDASAGESGEKRGNHQDNERTLPESKRARTSGETQ